MRRAAWMLAVATAMAVTATAAIVGFVLRAEFLTGAAEAVARAMFAHGVLAASAAASPIFAALLVGYAYLVRGMRRRAAREAAARHPR